MCSWSAWIKLKGSVTHPTTSFSGEKEKRGILIVRISPGDFTLCQDVMALLAPGLEVPAFCSRQSMIIRGEVTLAGEAMAAWKFASCKRIMCFGWDESTKFGDAVISCNFQIEHFDGSIEDVCLRGLSILPHGGTSAAVFAHIESHFFRHARRMLTLWMDDYEKKHGGAGRCATHAYVRVSSK